MNRKKNTLLWLIVGVIAGIQLSGILVYCGVPNPVALLLDSLFG